MDKGLNEIWEKTILSGERDWVIHLCCLERNETGLNYRRVAPSLLNALELYDCVIMYFVPLERFIFIVDFCGESPTEHTLEWASQCVHWDIVYYLHERGFRHTKFRMLDHHLEHFLGRKYVPEEDIISIIICYVGTRLGKFIQGDKRYNLAYAKAAVRKKYAQKATASLVLLKRQGLFCKDLMRMIVQRVGSYECMSKKEWEEYPMKYRETQIWEKKKFTPFQYAAIAGFLLIFLWGRFK